MKRKDFLDKFRARRKFALDLQEIEGLTYEEIGKKLKISQVAVGKLLLRARRDGKKEKQEADGEEQSGSAV